MIFFWFPSSSFRTQTRAVWSLGVDAIGNDDDLLHVYLPYICFLPVKFSYYPSRYPNLFASTRPVPSRSQKPLPVGPCWCIIGLSWSWFWKSCWMLKLAQRSVTDIHLRTDVNYSHSLRKRLHSQHPHIQSPPCLDVHLLKLVLLLLQQL